ncbi:DUF1284 domain-containing protein [Methanobrevibacter sp.]|uniref:DUF1284 domain-containing protein n=1 Tax=Methanobrevibacter sp. TaxID=66852 RepID=UPI0026E0F811|nr:DUF1284 domain-containing protein [Methanobrevibacter sp.]MDO5860698.1 DUF1284 domain-containing protein [Methanobrevibacter sp.]
MKLLLRGHHLLCLQGFQGYGYDENFVKNMTQINQKRKSENTIISLTNKSDDICKACPNLKNNLCQDHEQNERIIAMDDEVLSRIDKSKEYNAPDLFKQIGNIFNSKKSVDKICSKCMWHDKCLFYENI